MDLIVNNCGSTRYGGLDFSLLQNIGLVHFAMKVKKK